MNDKADNFLLPKIGFGTWNLSEGGEVENSTRRALEVGYRLIDTAKIYGNERGVGKAINGSDIPRQDIIVTTKLWPSDFGYDNTLVAFDESLQKLSLDYIDLYLIHWPRDDEKARHESWRAMIEIQGLGTVKQIGVSNFNKQQIQRITEASGHQPAVNQIEFHPFIYADQKDTLEFCHEQGIVVEAYSPLAQARDLKNDTINRIAKKHDRSPAQVMLRWAMAHDTIPIPRSSNSDRIKQNFEVFDFGLTADEVEQMNKLSRGQSVI